MSSFNSLPSSKTSPLPTTKLLTPSPPHSFSSTSQCITFKFNPRHNRPSPLSVTSPSIPYPEPQPQPSFNVEYLQSEFGSHDVSFTELGSSYVAKLVHENGSSASVLLPAGLVTSYKPKMWHGSSAELLQTSVSEGKSGPKIHGGVSLSLNCEDDDGFSWSPSSWVLSDVNGGSQDSIQVEMISRDLGKMVEVKHNLTLRDDALISEITVSNLGSLNLQLKGSILSHLTVSTPEATYAFGLERSNFFNRPPLFSNFSIIPPTLPKSEQKSPLFTLKRFFPDKKDERERQEEMEGEEDDNYKHLTEEMSKIYTSAPRNFTIIDRGKRNSVIVGRKGFEEVYLYSPGSSHEEYGKYAFVCVGQSALLKPITLPPGQLWIGEQILRNPNL